jgi:hypothetical protein
MWKIPASLLCGALALPLIGCAGNVTSAEVATTTPPVITGPPYVAGPRTFVSGPAGPAAILVVLPTSNADLALANPALWADEGIDLVMSQPGDFYRAMEDPNAAIARLVASARELANAPIWLLGAGPDINALLAAASPSGRGAVSGLVVTSVASNAGTCSESVYYSKSSPGSAPRVEVTRSGNCGTHSSVLPPRQPPAISAPPAIRPNSPRIIEASATRKRPAAQVHRLAQLMKAVPPS